MLLQFSVENFRSIKDRQVLDLVPSRERHHASNVFDADSARALKAVGIYGANASGKSNLIRAFHVMESIVRRSATKMNVGDKITPITPFRLLPQTIDQPTSFEIQVVIEGDLYIYGFAATKELIEAEWLSVRKKKGRLTSWFKRSGQSEDWSIGGDLKKKKDQRLLRENTRENGLVLSRGAELNVEPLIPLYLWFKKNFFVLDLSFPPRGLAFSTAERAHKSEEFRDRVTNFLRNADFGISGIQVTEGAKNTPREAIPTDAPKEVRTFLESLNKLMDTGVASEITVATEHRVVNGNIDEGVTFDLERDESNGTQRFFALANPILSALDDGDLLVIDELDCSIHPMLTRKIVELFLSEEHNKNGAQLVFVTHDSSLLDAKMLRRDQVWFAEKKENGSSEFFSLADFEVPPRKNEAFERRYLEGRYGGVPKFGPEFDALGAE